ncbi:DUF732 domain-containing protein [Mycolicibacterium rufum]|uniref:DUF732 domain-containing protein n=1 Tax=Mycolicibacterium rufum TaxID=318424 RepID=A0A9X3BF90_9MYCO|nr:DUF732 domain-containing protein [Mycolicibacterium rufum]KGI67025.1 hypothetical protein EU78_05675 [Mycolicibacterium rufum]MCV7070598.1 DUF732 domain-containing protein [Mycolicibacterium rufum]ULP37886.1 DUF732 domain-containing protein [Mycolicibacterium rufum]
MNHRRTVVAAIVAAGISLGMAAPAQAQTADQWFTDTVSNMNIPFAPNTDLPEVGKQVCEMLTTALQSNSVNPVPAVRGVLTTLTSRGLDRAQAGGLLKASVQAYCPQHARFVGR